MRIVMDADCIIKLTKAGMKEAVCRTFDVTLPRLVKEEVVDAGKRRNLPDALVVEGNIMAGSIEVLKGPGPRRAVGESEAVALFETGGFDAIGSDDKRFIKRLRALGIPYVTPASLVGIMVARGSLARGEADDRIGVLARYVSEGEMTALRLFLGRKAGR